MKKHIGRVIYGLLMALAIGATAWIAEGELLRQDPATTSDFSSSFHVADLFLAGAAFMMLCVTLTATWERFFELLALGLLLVALAAEIVAVTFAGPHQQTMPNELLVTMRLEVAFSVIFMLVIAARLILLTISSEDRDRV